MATFWAGAGCILVDNSASVGSVKYAAATLAAVGAIAVGCSSKPVAPVSTITPSVELTKTPKVKTACDVKFDELLTIEQEGVFANDPIAGDRDRYFDLQSKAREKIEEMNQMNCENNPGRVRF